MIRSLLMALAMTALGALSVNASSGVENAMQDNDSVTAQAPVPDKIDYGQIDAGVRGTVRLLNEHGFVTVDSGDGTKIDMDCAWEQPMVAVQTTKDALIDTADRLRDFLAERGVKLVSQGWELDSLGVYMQATYDPVLSPPCGLIVVVNLTDAVLGIEHAPLDLRSA